MIWTPESLDVLAAVMVPVAADLACRVRDYDAAGIEQAIGEMDVMQLRTLAVVLAVMVPDDRPLDDLIAWTRGDPPPPLEPITPAHAARNRAVLARELGLANDYRSDVSRNVSRRREGLPSGESESGRQSPTGQDSD